jgi:hypothetical protein
MEERQDETLETPDFVKLIDDWMDGRMYAWGMVEW